VFLLLAARFSASCRTIRSSHDSIGQREALADAGGGYSIVHESTTPGEVEEHA
jgi:hypothetical protein